MLFPVDELTQRAQQIALKRMTDICVVRRRTGKRITHPTTGVVSDEMRIVYSGVCDTQNNQVYPAMPDSAGHQYFVSVSTIKFPVTAETAALKVGDVAQIVRSVSPMIRGQHYVLRICDEKTRQSSVRFNVAAVVA